MVVEIRLFGELAVTIGPTVLGPRDFGGRKPKQLLQQLALGQGRAISKDQLAVGLWSEDTPRNYEACLEHYVSRLRRQLRANGVDAADIVRTEHRGYRLATERVWLDIIAFDELDRMCGGTDRALIERALDLLHGELLSDEPYADWAIEPRHRYQRRHRELATKAAELALADGDLDAAVAWAGTAAGIDSLDEASHRLLMLSHYARGERTHAMQVFAALARTLDDEAGVTPATTTTELHDAIVNQTPFRRLLPAPATPVVGLRTHPIQSPGASSTMPFLGRRSDLAKLRAESRSGEHGGCRLITVEGASGIGRSRLLDEAFTSTPQIAAIRTQCLPGMRHLPGALLRDLLRDVKRQGDPAPRLSSGSPAGEEEHPPGRIAIELEHALARRSSFTILIDDAHAADLASLQLLGYLAARHSSGHGLIVLAFNDDELTPDHHVFLSRVTSRIRLGPLSTMDLSPLGDPGLHQETGGLPLAVAARMSARSDEVVASLAVYRAALFARVRSGGERTWRVAVRCAITEPPAVPSAVAEALNLGARDVAEIQEQLCMIGVLQPTACGYEFTYPIMRTLLRETVTPARLSLLFQPDRGHREHTVSAEDTSHPLRAVAGDPRRIPSTMPSPATARRGGAFPVDSRSRL